MAACRGKVWRVSIDRDLVTASWQQYRRLSLHCTGATATKAATDMRNNPIRNRLFSAAVFLVVACASLVAAWLSYVSVQDAARIKFASTADDALNRIESSLDLNLSLLVSTRAFFRLRGADMSSLQFRQFFEALDVDRKFPGLRGIGYLRMVRTGDEDAAERDIVKAHGVERGIYPDTDQEWRAPIILFEPLEGDNQATIGYDMFTDPLRRHVFQRRVRRDEL